MSAVPPAGTTVLGLSPWVKILGGGLANFSSTVGGVATGVGNLVSSPVAASCFGCHDSAIEVAHMFANNATLVQRAATVTVTGTSDRSQGFRFDKTESCMVCHGTGQIADIKAMHAQ